MFPLYLIDFSIHFFDIFWAETFSYRFEVLFFGVKWFRWRWLTEIFTRDTLFCQMDLWWTFSTTISSKVNTGKRNRWSVQEILIKRWFAKTSWPKHDLRTKSCPRDDQRNTNCPRGVQWNKSLQINLFLTLQHHSWYMCVSFLSLQEMSFLFGGIHLGQN